MGKSAEQSHEEIQSVLRAEIRDLQFRHEVEISLLHATYAMALNGPADGVPSVDAQVASISQCPLFDAEWYLRKNPEVADSAMNAAEHYVRAGAFEGRNPGPDFDTMAYYLANADVAEAGWPALVHFLLKGQSEGRPVG